MKQLLLTTYRLNIVVPRTSLLYHAQFGYKTVVQKRYDPVFEEEKRVYADEMRKLRKQHL